MAGQKKSHRHSLGRRRKRSTFRRRILANSNKQYPSQPKEPLPPLSTDSAPEAPAELYWSASENDDGNVGKVGRSASYTVGGGQKQQRRYRYEPLSLEETTSFSGVHVMDWHPTFGNSIIEDGDRNTLLHRSSSVGSLDDMAAMPPPHSEPLPRLGHSHKMARMSVYLSAPVKPKSMFGSKGYFKTHLQANSDVEDSRGGGGHWKRGRKEVELPAPNFLRKLGLRISPEAAAANADNSNSTAKRRVSSASGSGDTGSRMGIENKDSDVVDCAATPESKRLQHPIPLHFTALKRAAKHLSTTTTTTETHDAKEEKEEVDDINPPSSPAVGSRLAHFTRKLFDSLLLSSTSNSKQHSHKKEMSISAVDSLSTFDTNHHQQQIYGGFGEYLDNDDDDDDDSILHSPTAASNPAHVSMHHRPPPHPTVDTQKKHGGSSMKFLRHVSNQSRVVGSGSGMRRKAAGLTIPTAKMPMFLPGSHNVSITSPACASLQTEVVTATTTASNSTLASPGVLNHHHSNGNIHRAHNHPASAGPSRSMFFDSTVSLDEQPVPSSLQQQSLPTAPAVAIAASSAHGILCRLADASRYNNSYPQHHHHHHHRNSPRRGHGKTKSVGGRESINETSWYCAHTDVREEWGLFITECLRSQESGQVVPTMTSSTTVVSNHEQQRHRRHSTISSPETIVAAAFASIGVPPAIEEEDEVEEETVVVPQQAPKDKNISKHWFSNLNQLDIERFHMLISRGVPDEFRRQVWMECAGALDVDCSCSPLTGNDQRPETIEEIELDVLRADPFATDTARIQDDQQKKRSSQIEHKANCIRQVLYSYAHTNPEVGYCQGMNKIVNGLLDAGINMDDSLALLRCLLDGGILPAEMFKSPMTRVQTDQLVLEELVSRHLPELSTHFKDTSVSLAPVTVNWFLTLLVDCLPDQHRLRVWDMLFVHGYSAIFQACLAILEMNQDAFLQCESQTDVYVLLQNMRSVMEHVNVDEFSDLAFGSNYHMGYYHTPLLAMRDIDQIQCQQQL